MGRGGVGTRRGIHDSSRRTADSAVVQVSAYMPPVHEALTRSHSFMDINWQWGNPSNPADAAIGPQVYDNHLYYK
jgi:hypothetical protein